LLVTNFTGHTDLMTNKRLSGHIRFLSQGNALKVNGAPSNVGMRNVRAPIVRLLSFLGRISRLLSLDIDRLCGLVVTVSGC
jgi:hypothetical protein